MMVDHYEGEDVIIVLERDGSSTVTNIEGKVTSINISGGEENTEVKYAFGNKQILFGKPKEKFSVELEVFMSNTAQFNQAFLGGSTLGAGTELKSSSSQDNWRITMFLQPYAQHVSNGSVVLPSLTDPDTRVMQFVDCRAVKFDKTFEAEDMLTGTISFEFSSSDADGYANYFDYYTNSTTSTLIQWTTTYTGEHRGNLTWTTTTTKAWSGAYST